jgi:hypothetical protein
VHVVRLGKTDCAAHQPFDPGPQIDVFALDFLRIVLAHPMLFGVEVPLVGTPPIRVIAHNAKRLQQRVQLEKNGILAAPEDVGSHVPTVMINRVPQPPRVRFAAHITPHFVQL